MDHGLEERVGAGRRLVRSPAFLAPVALIFVLAAMAVSPELFGAGDPFDCSLSRSLDGPRSGHPFGFDLQGCDYYTRVLNGARSSLAVAVLVVVLTGLIGIVVGSLSAMRGGWVDAAVNQLTDVLLSVPLLLAAAFVMTLVGDRGVLEVVVGLTVLSWPPMTRLVRAEVRSLHSREYVDAARALGAGKMRLLRRHILPNAIWPILAFAAGFTAIAVAAEAILTFLGAGLELPAISWGLMLAQARFRSVAAPHLLIPALFLSATVAAFVFLSEACRRVFEADD
ncbi:MAG TPA: ABC transporter permease [Actinomycetota bacterium]|nr:ABC transporter permease [Actinomycetota bacterium]